MSGKQLKNKGGLGTFLEENKNKYASAPPFVFKNMFSPSNSHCSLRVTVSAVNMTLVVEEKPFVSLFSKKHRFQGADQSLKVQKQFF